MKQEKSSPQTEWSQRVALWQESGKSARKWCLENDVNYVSFFTWRRLLLENGSHASIVLKNLPFRNYLILASPLVGSKFPSLELGYSFLEAMTRKPLINVSKGWRAGRCYLSPVTLASFSIAYSTQSDHSFHFSRVIQK